MPSLTQKGQVTVPKAIRQALGLHPGAEVVFELREGEAVLRKAVPSHAMDRWRGFLKGSGLTTDEVLRSLRDE